MGNTGCILLRGSTPWLLREAPGAFIITPPGSHILYASLLSQSIQLRAKSQSLSPSLSA